MARLGEGVLRKVHLVALIASLASGSALAQTIGNNGSWVYGQCSKPLGDVNYVPNAALCVRFLQGVFNTLVNNPTRGVPCFPSNLTMGQLKDVVTEYVGDKDKPERLQYSATSVVESAWGESFSCQR
jgi:hypothetical protein